MKEYIVRVRKEYNVPFTKIQYMEELVRCKDCAFWDRETIRQNSNDVAWWNEAECKQLAERDGWNEIDHFTDDDFFCAYGEKVTE